MSAKKVLIALWLLCATAFGATEDKVTIKPSGGDYTSLGTWETGEDDTGDLVTRGVYHVAEVDGDWSADGNNSYFTVLGWTTSSECYIEIRVASGCRHAGKWDTSKYRLYNSSGPVGIQEDYVTLNGLQIEYTGSTSTYGINAQNINTSSSLMIRECLIKSSASAGTSYGIYINDADAKTTIRNTVLFGNWNRGIMSIAGAATAALNCTVYGATNGYRQAGGMGVTNCVAQACVDGFYTVTNALNNCSDISSDAPGSNPRTGSVSFLDAVNGDFHLSASDTIAKDYGANLSATFTTDIDGETRSGTWDIGADEVAGDSQAVLRPRRAFVIFDN